MTIFRKSYATSIIHDTSQLITLTHFIPKKNLWDWLTGVIIPTSIPVSIFFWGLSWQRRQQEITNLNLRDEALETYLKDLSNILFDKKLLLLPSNDALVEVGLNIIRARTLSILRRLKTDGRRIATVFQFLTDTNLLTKFNLDLREVELSYIKLENINFSSAILTGAKFDHAILINLNFRNADLSYTYLSNSYLSKTNLSNTNLSNANLTGTEFMQTDLSNANLDNATLAGVKVHFFFFDEKSNSTSFRKANLHKAHLYGSDLGNADLDGANLSEANLNQTDLTKVQNLKPDQVKAANNWEKAKYSPDFYKKLGLPK